MAVQEDSSFDIEPGFCGNCGTILPLLTEDNFVMCVLCRTKYGLDYYGQWESYYVLKFHTPEEYLEVKEEGDVMNDGPVVTRKCPKCGCEKMSYSTLQLRSADEGQTVFYKCIKCKYSESENS